MSLRTISVVNRRLGRRPVRSRSTTASGFDLGGGVKSGFSADEIATLDVDENDGHDGPTKAPDAPAAPVSEIGDIGCLGVIGSFA